MEMGNLTIVETRNLKTKFGGKSKNQTVITLSDGSQHFFSYGSLIAIKQNDGSIELTSKWNHSNTTNYYRCQFLDEEGKTTRTKIEKGIYKMI